MSPQHIVGEFANRHYFFSLTYYRFCMIMDPWRIPGVLNSMAHGTSTFLFFFLCIYFSTTDCILEDSIVTNDHIEIMNSYLYKSTLASNG